MKKRKHHLVISSKRDTFFACCACGEANNVQRFEAQNYENDISQAKCFVVGCKCTVQLNNNNECFAGGIFL